MSEDIEKIMSEIEELQQEMSVAATPASAATTSLAEAPKATKKSRAKASSKASLKVVDTPSPDESARVEGSPGSCPGSNDDALLDEFRAAAHVESEASLETALGDLSEDGSGGAMSLLDETLDGVEEPLDAEAEAPTSEESLHAVEAPAEAPVDEESTFAEEAIAEEAIAEEAIAEESAEATLAEEESRMNAELAAAQQSVKSAPDGEYSDEHEVSMSDESNEGCLTMQLTGNMTLKLKYEYEGQEVTVGFSDGALKVTLADGTEFKVPVGKKKQLKRVA